MTVAQTACQPIITRTQKKGIKRDEKKQARLKAAIDPVSAVKAGMFIIRKSKKFGEYPIQVIFLLLLTGFSIQ